MPAAVPELTQCFAGAGGAGGDDPKDVPCSQRSPGRACRPPPVSTPTSRISSSLCSRASPTSSRCPPGSRRSSTPSIVIASILLVGEIIVDKIPAFDSVNDALGTIVRPASGAVVFAGTAAAANLDNSPWMTQHPVGRPHRRRHRRGHLSHGKGRRAPRRERRDGWVRRARPVDGGGRDVDPAQPRGRLRADPRARAARRRRVGDVAAVAPGRRNA